MGCSSSHRRPGSDTDGLNEAQAQVADKRSSPAVAAPEGKATQRMASPEERKQAEAIKVEANELFKKGKYRAAADRYTEAIAFADIPVLYVNRALCNRKLEDWDACERDAQLALKLDSGHMKANYLRGMALRKQLRYAEAARHLDRALNAAQKAGDGIQDEIWREVAACSFSWWQQASQVRRDKQERLRRRLAAYIDEHTGAEDAEKARDRQDLAELFQLAARCDTEAEAEGPFVCTLSLEPFREPVTTPDGNSYERAALLEHLAKVGEWEPISRNPLRKEDLVLNRKLRAATRHYLDEHPWLWAECVNPTY